jgi:hypothetical protein
MRRRAKPRFCDGRSPVVFLHSPLELDGGTSTADSKIGEPHELN